MIKKIISGGQTGADQAALDTAIQWDILHGGWIPKGRLTEAGALPDKYHLQEMPTGSYPARTEKNVIDSDGTLIISHGPLSGGSGYTQEMALKHNKPFLHIDLNEIDAFNSAKRVYNWIKRTKIETLNVAGPSASKDPFIYQATIHLLSSVFHIELIETCMPDLDKIPQSMPHTVEETVEILIDELQLKDKTKIAKMRETDLTYLQPTLGSYVRNKFGLWIDNEALLQDCRSKLGKYDIREDEASSHIIRELWNRLRETYALRIIKGKKDNQ